MHTRRRIFFESLFWEWAQSLSKSIAWRVVSQRENHRLAYMNRQLWCSDCELASAKLESYVAPYLQSLDSYKVLRRDLQGHQIEKKAGCF